MSPGKGLGGMLSPSGLGPVLRLMPWIPAMMAAAAAFLVALLSIAALNGLGRGDEAVTHADLMVMLLASMAAALVAGTIVKLLPSLRLRE